MARSAGSFRLAIRVLLAWPSCCMAAAAPSRQPPSIRSPVLVVHPRRRRRGVSAAAYRRRDPRARGKRAGVPRRRQPGPALGRCRRPASSAARCWPNSIPATCDCRRRPTQAQLRRGARPNSPAPAPIAPATRSSRSSNWSAVPRSMRRTPPMPPPPGRSRPSRAQLDVARNAAGYAQLRAPRDGVIANRQAEAGQVVAAGQAVFTLAGDAGREVAIALPEARIREFHVGQPVAGRIVERARASAGPERSARSRPPPIRRRAPTPRASRSSAPAPKRSNSARARASTSCDDGNARTARSRCRHCSAARTARARCGWSIRRRASCISTPVRTRRVRLGQRAGRSPADVDATGSSPPADTCCTKASACRRSIATTGPVARRVARDRGELSHAQLQPVGMGAAQPLAGRCTRCSCSR